MYLIVLLFHFVCLSKLALMGVSIFSYWLEEASKVYPSNKNLKKLREKISCAKDGLEYVDIESQGAELNGNNDPNESDDNVAYW